MEKILLVPDSFKGTLSSRQVCQVMAGQLRRFFPQAQVKSIPVADGGEGSVEAFLAAAGGERRTRTVTGPFGEPVEAFYGVLGDGRTAVIEMAACAGLPLAEGRMKVTLIKDTRAVNLVSPAPRRQPNCTTCSICMNSTTLRMRMIMAP